MKMLETNSQTKPCKNLTLGGIVASFINLTLKGGLDHGEENQMGILPSHLSTLSQSQSFGEDTDPGGILSCVWLQSKVRHCQAQRSHTPVQTSRKALAPCPHLQLSSAFDPASRLGSVGLPLVSASESLTPALVAVGQKTLPLKPNDRTATFIDLGTPDRPPTQSEKNPAPTTPLWPHQTRHAAQTPYPYQNRFLECQNPRLYRNRSGLALRQLRKGRVHLFPQCHRYLFDLGRNPCRHGQRPIRGENGHGRHRTASTLQTLRHRFRQRIGVYQLPPQSLL